MLFVLFLSLRFLLQVSSYVTVTDKRQAEAGRIREKYPDRIPVRILIRATAVLGVH